MAKKILIVSDTHGKNDNLRKAIANMGDQLDLMIHLGDSLCSLETMKELASCPVEMVRGNCDSMMHGLPISKLIQVEQFKVLITHGHQYGGKWGVNSMKEAARENGAQIVMFGHSHEPVVEPYGDVVVLNPGSLSQPRQEGHRPTYIVMTIEEDGRANYALVQM